jgi:hypothetical protein
VLHAHGPGIGVAVIQPPDASLSAWMHDTASKLAEDIIVFDQRGCASPRICAVIAAPELARQFAERVAEELRRLQEQVPRGRLSETETADRLRYRDTLAYAAELLGDDTGFVSVQTDTPALVVPPVGRAIHIVRAESALVLLPLSENIVAVGVAGPAYLAKEMAAAFPRARVSALGGMQSPPLDGALDRRADPMAKP